MPQLLTQPARRAVLDLFRAAGSAETEQAPWWRTDDLPANVTPLPQSPASPEDPFMNGRPTSPDHPTLRLLGDVDLIGTAGTVPGRAVGQCMEYCAWLLENPGHTPTAMTRALMIAETTRRSNISRLRSWLGAAPDGLQYLPDAYSGRVALDPRVSSDWERFRAMLSGGVNVSSDAALVAALRLVRGEPLGSFEFQWGWAAQLRTDMVAMIVDAACVLADRALDRQEAEAALWAVRRGTPGGARANDGLAAREILALALAGRSAEASGVAVALTRAARAGGPGPGAGPLAPDPGGPAFSVAAARARRRLRRARLHQVQAGQPTLRRDGVAQGLAAGLAEHLDEAVDEQRGQRLRRVPARRCPPRRRGWWRRPWRPWRAAARVGAGSCPTPPTSTGGPSGRSGSRPPPRRATAHPGPAGPVPPSRP